MVKLDKIIDPTSLRGIGQRPSGWQPNLLPISARGLQELLKVVTPAISYYIDGIDLKNAVVVVVEQCAFLYVNPEFRQYRHLANRRFPDIPPGYDVDHVLAKKLAKDLGHSYVLVAIIPQGVNRSHGPIESRGLKELGSDLSPEVCFPDERIFHKLLGRRPYARQSKKQLENGFDPEYQLECGLTLKQAGVWNTSLGLDQKTPENFRCLLLQITAAV